MESSLEAGRESRFFSLKEMALYLNAISKLLSKENNDIGQKRISVSLNRAEETQSII